jgi:hypothetical protein
MPPADPTDPITHPKVFISYAWSDVRKEMVLEVGKSLLQDGIDVVLDLWEVRGGDDHHHFMERSVSDPTITKVLAFCDKLYAEKADNREGGVGAEAQILTPELYNKVTSARVIPIACESDDEGKAYMPVFLKNRYYIDSRDQTRYADNYRPLVELIYNKPELQKPPLGEAPQYIREPGVASRRAPDFIGSRHRHASTTRNIPELGISENKAR